MKYGDAIRAVLDEATTITGAILDALDEALNCEGTPATDRAIQAALDRADRHLPPLAARLEQARSYQVTVGSVPEGDAP